MLQIDRVGLLLAAAFLAVCPTGMAFAQPEAFHGADADGITDIMQPVMAAAFDESIGSSAEAFESFDGVNAGGYRYFGFLSVGIGPEGLTAGASTHITGLDPGKRYIVMLTQHAQVQGGGLVSIGLGPEGADFFVGYDESGVDSVFGSPYQIITGFNSLTAVIGMQQLDDPPGVIEASAALSVVEVTSDSQLHNDCDINDDGLMDDLDIDLLNLVLRSGLAGPGADADVIGMFDVDGDGDVDLDDRDELVEGAGCLNTLYGDTDLDGDVDGFDIMTATSNVTGSVGAAGGKGWADGDVDGDGDVDDFDILTMLANHTGSL